MQAFRVWSDIYIVGGPAISHPLDCCVYLNLVLIIATHRHIDHVGGLAEFK